MQVIVKNRLKEYKAEKVVLLILIALGVVLTLTGMGVYFYVSELTIVKQAYATPTRNFMISQLKLVCNFARVLGVVFSLVGVVSILLALDRLTFSKESYKMALYINSQKEK